MKTTILILLLTFGMRGQNTWDKVKQRDDVLHFYGAVTINDVSYHVQSFAAPKWSANKKILVSNGVTISCMVAKEFYDMRKPRPTGFSWMDIFMGSWGTIIYDIVRVCINDFKKKDEYSFESKRLIVY
jgi:uncharacterized membrane protein